MVSTGTLRPSEAGLQIQNNSGVPAIYVANKSAGFIVALSSSGGALALNAPHHILVLYKESRAPTEVELWVDGVLRGSGNSSGAPSADDPAVALKLLGGSAVGWYGEMADVCICNQANDADVAKLITYEKAKWGIP
jgi:hypothetical protein